jgi:hypothetical protein
MPSVTGDAATAIDLAINRAKMGLACHPSNRCCRNPSINCVRANEGKLPQQMNKVPNDQLVEEVDQPVRAL